MCQYCEMPEEIFDGCDSKAGKYIDYRPEGWHVEAYPTWDDNDLGTRIKLVFVRDDRESDDGVVRLSDIEGWNLASWNHEFMVYEIGAPVLYYPVCGRELAVRDMGSASTAGEPRA